MKIDGYCTLGVDREYNMTENSLLEAMDQAGVDRAVIAPPDRFFAIYNREGNEQMLKAAKDQGGRFIPTCCANPWYGPPATQEIERALGEGARMVLFHPAVQGFSANDEIIFPLLDCISENAAPVYVHTGPPGNATPWQIVDLAERYPAINFVMGHCGATDFWNDVIVSAEAHANIYLESSLARPFHFARYMKALGKERGIMGSWAPLNNLAFEWHEMRKFTSTDVFEEISGKNLARLLGKEGPL